MPLVNKVKIGPVRIERAGDYTKADQDPAAAVPSEQLARLPQGKNLEELRRDYYNFPFAMVSEPKPGRRADGTTPERLYWFYEDKLISSKETFLLPQLEFCVDLARGRGLFVAAKELLEFDLKTGASSKIPYHGWTLDASPRGAHYLLGDYVLITSITMWLGRRDSSGVKLETQLDAKSWWHLSIDQRVVLATSREDWLLLGFHEGRFRKLAQFEAVTLRTVRRIAEDKIRVYLPDGAFDILGARDAWDHCFRGGHETEYPLLDQKPV